MVKPVAPKPRARRKVEPFDTAALDSALQAAGAPAPTVAALPAKSVPPRAAAGISPYPDLHMAISMLGHRAKHATGERRVLIDKWISQLNKIHTEMIKLRKLEKLTSNLTQPHQESLPL